MRFYFTAIPELPKHYQNDSGNPTPLSPDQLAQHSMIGKRNACLQEQRDLFVLSAKPGHELKYE